MKSLIKSIIISLLTLLYITPVYGAVLTGGQEAFVDTTRAAYSEAYEAEHHVHNDEHWFKRRAVPTGTSFADTSHAVFYSFTLTTAADSTLGTFVQILGTDDTPVTAGNTYIDLHRLYITDVDDSTPFQIVMVWGTSVAAGFAAGTFGSIPVASDAANPNQATPYPVDIMTARMPVGTNMWMAASNAAGVQEISLWVGGHEYER